MSDKQRADHVTAKYWNGFITRTEAQKVFDEYGQVIQAQAVAIQKLDAVVSCLAEKFGVTAEEVNTWVKGKIEAQQKATPTSVPDATGDSLPQESTPSPIVLTD